MEKSRKTYRVVVIEDSEEDRGILERNLESYGIFQIVGNLSTGFHAEDVVGNTHPDLLFVDVELPGIQGYDLVERLRGQVTWNMKVVFYTAHPQYMLNAIRVSAFDYLLKPFDKKDLDGVVERFLQVRNRETEAASAGTDAVLPKTEEGSRKTFTIQLPTGDIRILRLSDIGYFKFNALRRCWEVFLCNRKLLTMRSSINANHILGFSSQFMQIHKSYIINVQYLAVIHADVCMMFPPFDGEKLPISGKYKKELQSCFIRL